MTKAMNSLEKYLTAFENSSQSQAKVKKKAIEISETLEKLKNKKKERNRKRCRRAERGVLRVQKRGVRDGQISGHRETRCQHRELS